MQVFPRLASAESKHALISKVLKQLKHFPTTILSLDSDTSDGLELFAEQHQLSGIVTDKAQLANRKSSLPRARLYAQSLLSYRVPQKVQLTYLLDQKMNTLVGEAKWTKLIGKMFDHLEPYGILVFDVYMDSYFEYLRKSSGELVLNDTQATIASWKEKKGVYSGKQTSFVKEEESDLYTREDHTQSYQTFTAPMIKKMLAAFDSVHVLDWKGKKQHKKSDHVVIVAQKGW